MECGWETLWHSLAIGANVPPPPQMKSCLLLLHAEAHKTLRTCEEQKELLGKKIEETTEKIKNKRSHLESIRGELKMLS